MRSRDLALVVLVALFAGLVTAGPASAATVAGACSGNASGDFNGDGADDLAVGVPDNDSATGEANSGAVFVVYSNAGALDPAVDQQQIDQDSTGIGGSTGPGDRFGECLAAGDFDNDGHDDLAIGVPGENRAADVLDGDLANDAGAVQIVYGSVDGLDPVDADVEAQTWDQDEPGVPGGNEVDDEFGTALAAGDFDADDADDLAVGAPNEAIRNLDDAGAVFVLLGDEGDGISASGARLFHQDVRGIIGASETNDEFGAALASGDFDSDSEFDLAIGVPGEDIGTKNAAGAVQSMYGAPSGIAVARNQLWHQDVPDVVSVSRAADRFGDGLAAGNFDSDNSGFDDLAIGVPGKTWGDASRGGVVHMVHGGSTGLRSSSDRLITSDQAEDNDRFGSVLIAGLFDDADEGSDLAVGIPLHDVGAEDDAGAVEVFQSGGGARFFTAGSQFVDQSDIALTPEEDEAFGRALTSGNFDGDDDVEDIAIGVPNQDVAAVTDGGEVDVIYDVATLDTPTPITEEDVGGTAEVNDHFGEELG